MLESRQLSQKGVAALEHKNVNEAERLLAQAVRACGADPDARRYYAEALWLGGSRKEAIDQLHTAIVLSPHDPNLLRQLATYELEQGNLSRAREAADQAIDLDPQAALSWTMRAKINQQSNQIADALADYQRSLGLDPEQHDVVLEIAEVYRAQNQPHRALAALQMMRESYAPGEEPAHIYYLMGLASSALGRPDDAIVQFETARNHGEGSPEVLFQLAQAQWTSGQTVQAEQTATELLTRMPNHGPGRDLLAQIRNGGPNGTLVR